MRPSNQLASHVLAKQVYWCVADNPVDNSGFHLLQPLYSSSLSQAVHAEINDARFSEANAEARKARSKNKPHSEPFRVYPELAVRKLGGSNKQNISLLNLRRNGDNYLLASLPPRWKQSSSKALLGVESVIGRFFQGSESRRLLNNLVALLKADPDNVMETRQKRELIERSLGQTLAAFGAETRETKEAGWTQDPACDLALNEKIWLDPQRANLPVREDHREEDVAFLQALEWKDWPDEVAHQFGNYINARLMKEGLPVGDTEHFHWAKQAIVDTAWPATIQRRSRTEKKEVASV